MLKNTLKTGLCALGIFSTTLCSPVFSDENSLFYPTRTDWAHSRGQTNLSVFVFNDLNGNGVYDLHDKAFAGIATGLSRNNTPLTVSRTNISGFANYPASTSQDTAVISAVGMYDFEVFAPPGWRVSTQNTTQRREMALVEGSNAGLGMAEMLHPVGLERFKFIRGTYGMPAAGPLALWQNGAMVSEINLMPGEEFLLPVEPGEYKLISNGFERPVQVRAYPVDIGTLTPAALAPRSGTEISFETLAPYGVQKIPNGYNGLNWFNLNAITATAGDVGYANGATSGSNVLYTSSGHPAHISAQTGFDFIEVNLSVAWPEAETEELLISYYRKDTLILQDRIGLSAYGVITYQPLITNITRIELSTAHNWQAVLDDMIVSLSP